MKVFGKHIIVTGAGSGMGRELTRELLRRGARVAAVDINEKALAQLSAGASPALSTFACNIADRAAVETLAEALLASGATVDGIINCAGVIQPFESLNELSFSHIERVFDVNFRGTLYMTKTFLPVLLTRPEAHIVNVSSMGGFIPIPGQTAYGCSKAAVKLLTEGLYAELRGTRVHVTVVFPGAVATDIMANSGVEMRGATEAARSRIYPADRAARDILDGMERDAFRVLVGRDAKLLDYLYRLAPKRATEVVAKKMQHLLAHDQPVTRAYVAEAAASGAANGADLQDRA